MTEVHQGDIIRRGLRRDQPVKLTQEELLDKMRAFTLKDAERDELTDELTKETKKRKQQIEELDDEISGLKRCIRTGEEDRSVSCFERMDRRGDGTWEVVLIRADTNAVVERRSAHAAELQRHLPNEYDGKATGTASFDVTDAEPGADAPDEDDSEAAKNGKPKPEKFDSDLLADGKCALRFEGGNGCELELGHKGLHKSESHSWRARRPKPTQDAADSDVPAEGMVAEALAQEQSP